MIWERATAGTDLDELFEQLESWHDGGESRESRDEQHSDDEHFADA